MSTLFSKRGEITRHKSHAHIRTGAIESSDTWWVGGWVSVWCVCGGGGGVDKMYDDHVHP